MTTLVRDKKTKAIINTDRGALQAILMERQLKQDMIVLSRRIDVLSEDIKTLRQEIAVLKKDLIVG